MCRRRRLAVPGTVVAEPSPAGPVPPQGHVFSQSRRKDSEDPQSIRADPRFLPSAPATGILLCEGLPSASLQLCEKYPASQRHWPGGRPTSPALHPDAGALVMELPRAIAPAPRQASPPGGTASPIRASVVCRPVSCLARRQGDTNDARSDRRRRDRRAGGGPVAARRRHRLHGVRASPRAARTRRRHQHPAARDQGACGTGPAAGTGPRRHPHARADLCQPLRPGGVARAARHRRRLRHAAILHPSRQAAHRAAGRGARAARRRQRCAAAAGWCRSPNAATGWKRASNNATAATRSPPTATCWSAPTASTPPCAPRSIPTRARRCGTAPCYGAAPPTGRSMSMAAPW